MRCGGRPGNATVIGLNMTECKEGFLIRPHRPRKIEIPINQMTNGSGGWPPNVYCVAVLSTHTRSTRTMAYFITIIFRVSIVFP